MATMMACKGVGCNNLTCAQRTPHEKDTCETPGASHDCFVVCNGQRCEPVEEPMSVKTRVIELAKMLESGAELEYRKPGIDCWHPVGEIRHLHVSDHAAGYIDIRAKPAPLATVWIRAPERKAKEAEEEEEGK